MATQTKEERAQDDNYIFGRPLKLGSVEEFEEGAKKYFKHCKDNREHPFITGLALWFDCDRHILDNYEKGKHDRILECGLVVDFSSAIKRAKENILYYKEQILMNKSNPTGVIFDLKNNSSKYYKDKIEVEGSIHVGVSLSQLTSGLQGDKKKIQ